MAEDWRIRRAGPDDAPAFRPVHHRAVHGQPEGRAEPPEVRTAWSPPPDDPEALARTREDLSRPRLAAWLAEGPEGAPATSCACRSTRPAS